MSRRLPSFPKPAFRVRRSVFGICCVLAANVLLGWGPHPEITAQAVTAIGPDAPLAKLLGPEIGRLRVYCWIPDVWMQLSGEFYNDDYLFTPQRPTHLQTSHAFASPDGKYGAHTQAMFDLYFRRALQALRTESPANAARWIGTILHFTEDTGAPPHAICESGPLHSPMENWVDGKKITIAGYIPKILGTEDEDAAAAFWANQERLHAFVCEKAQPIKLLVRDNNRAAAEPLIRECANASARNAADLCATLGALAEQGPKGNSLHGRISGATQECPLGKMAAKIMLAETGYSTLAAPDGTYEFRNIPAGSYRLLVAHPGNEVYSGTVNLTAANQTFDIALEPARVRGNMFRNPALTLRWTSKDHIDMWYKARRLGGWRTEAVPVTAGASYCLETQWKKSGSKATLYWSTHEREGKQTEAQALIAPDTKCVATAPDGVKFAFVTVECSGLPDEALSYIALAPHVGVEANTATSVKGTPQ